MTKRRKRASSVIRHPSSVIRHPSFVIRHSSSVIPPTMPYLLIALGSALGGVLRFWLSALVGARLGQAYLGTVFVNVSGCFVIGFLAALGPMPFTRQLFMIGLLGGYTTFSSFSLQTLELAHEGRLLAAGTNVALSVVLSLAAVWLGHLCGAMLRKP
jgi:fluoride exporter